MARLDPQVERVLERLPEIARDRMSPDEARRASRERGALLHPPSAAVARVFERTLRTAAGDVGVRIYAPGGTDLPALVYLHGGGWVLGDLDAPDALCRRLANAARCVVVSVDYPLAPEHPFPVALEASYAVTKWLAENARSLDVDPSRIAVGGESAGGNLAAAMALAARDRGGPRLVFQVLLVPVLNYAFDTPSYAENAEGYRLTRNEMQWFWSHYLRDVADGANPYASLLRANDLSGVPPAVIVIAEFDPLRDEGEAYARRLRDSGVAVECRRYEGVVHGFIPMAGEVDSADRAIDDIGRALRTAFSR